MFAGEANVSKSCRIHSLPGVSCDYIFGGKAMDLLTPSGMALSSSNVEFVLMVMTVCEYGWQTHVCQILPFGILEWPFNIFTISMPSNTMPLLSDPA